MKTEYNSKLDKNIEPFVLMRIEGKSFDEIADTLKISKATLIEWNKQMSVRDAITEGKAVRINTIIRGYQFNKASRLCTYLQLSKKISEELLKRDLSKLSTDTLLKMSVTNDSRVNDLIKDICLIGKEDKGDFGKLLENSPDGYFYLKLDD